jgi:hypothetical protein
VKRIATPSAAAGPGARHAGPAAAAGRPPGYPPEYQRQVRLRDGRRVVIRPILPSDAPGLAEAIKTADPGTLRRRFLGRPPRVTPALLAHLATVDYVRRFALVAIDPGTQKGVAIARFKQTGNGVAEIAVAVSPAWRRAGLARVSEEGQMSLPDRNLRTFDPVCATGAVFRWEWLSRRVESVGGDGLVREGLSDEWFRFPRAGVAGIGFGRRCWVVPAGASGFE